MDAAWKALGELILGANAAYSTAVDCFRVTPAEKEFFSSGARRVSSLKQSMDYITVIRYCTSPT